MRAAVSGGEVNNFTLLQLFAGPGEGAPNGIPFTPEQGGFDPGRGVTTRAEPMQPGWNNACVVDGEYVAGSKLLRQVEDCAMLESRRALWADNEEPRRVARISRTQRYIFRRQ